MRSVRVAAILFGVAFGFLISWGRFTDPDVIRRMLLLQDAYMYLMMGSAVVVGFIGVRLVRRYQRRALLTGEPVAWESTPLAPRHLWGSALFGLGWALTDACPGPIAAQLGQGVVRGVYVGAGVVIGVVLFLRRRSSAPARVPGGLVPASAPE